MNTHTSRLRQFAAGRFSGYGLAVLATAAALLISRLLNPLLQNRLKFAFLFPAVALAALYGGIGPAILATVLGFAGVFFWFDPGTGPAGIVVVVIYVITCGLITAVAASSRRAKAKLERVQHESAKRDAAEIAGMKRLLDMADLCVRPGNDMSSCLDAIVDAAIFLTGAEKGNLQLFDRASGTLRLAAHSGFDEPFLTFFAEVRATESACGTAMESRRRVIVEDVTQSEIFAGKPSREVNLSAGVHAVQSTPLVSSAGSLLGVISTHYPVPRGQRARDLHLMDLLAVQAADYLERKQSEEVLEAITDRLRRFLEAAPTGLTHCSHDLRYLEVNSTYAAMAGLTPEQIEGRPIPDVMGAEAWNKIRPYVERVLQGEQVEYEMVLPFFQGGPHHIHVVYTPEKNGEQVVGWYACVSDTTDFRSVEERLHRIEKLAAAGQLAASLSHEINNPLTSVTNILYLLRNHSDLDLKARSLIETAEKELGRVSRIVRQSLSYYRTGSEAKELDLSSIVEESLQIFADRLQRARIRVTKKIVPGHSIVGYQDEVRQVIDNLLLNAEEAMSTGGCLRVSVRGCQSWTDGGPSVRMSVGDTGCGIAKEHLSSVFEPFFTTKSERGTGLGLWVIRGIVSKHEGRIKIRSTETPGKSGTVVSILWPLSSGAPRKSDTQPVRVKDETAQQVS